jgi:hypothetical protein
MAEAMPFQNWVIKQLPGAKSAVSENPSQAVILKCDSKVKHSP